jgi:acyl-coenzyme A thioesterase PaaI-like protein
VVTAEFDCDPCYQGYPQRLHGGIIALLLDTAMTHCLFSRGLQGVTARLEVRYYSPVEIGVRAFIRAYFLRNTRRLHRIRAEIIQQGTARASGEGTFLPIGNGGPDSERYASPSG